MATLTFDLHKLDQDIIYVQHRVKFGDYKSKGSGDMSFCLANFRLV